MPATGFRRLEADRSLLKSLSAAPAYQLCSPDRLNEVFDMARSQIEYRGELISETSPLEAFSIHSEAQDTIRAARSVSTWQFEPRGLLIEIGLFWIAALACLVAFSIWAL